MLVFGQRHAHRYLRRLFLEASRLDVRKLKEGQCREPPLRALYAALTIGLTFSERELAQDDIVADGLVAVDFDGSKDGCRTWLGGVDDRNSTRADLILADGHLGIWVAEFAEIVRCRLTAGAHHGAVERRS